jgi:hypothetical protein
MNDEPLATDWETLAPTVLQRQRIEVRVAAWLEAHDTSLAAEWLGLLKVSPLAAVGLGAVSAVSIATAPPFLWLVRALLRA